jgi:hypothetical protein
VGLSKSRAAEVTGFPTIGGCIEPAFAAVEQARSGWKFCGAMFFCMNREMLWRLTCLLPPRVKENRHIDAYLSAYLERWGVALYSHRPTLVQHTGDAHSTYRCAPDAYTRQGHGYVDEELHWPFDG